MELLKNLISGIHIISASLSLLLGLVVLFGRKGSLRHKKLGQYYFYAMLINNLSSLFIYNARGDWFFPHTLAIVTIVVLLPGYLITYKKTYKHWLKIHISSMVVSYYMLIGGAINEAFLHLEPLRQYLGKAEVMGMTHFFAQLLFVGLLVFYLIKYKNNRQHSGQFNASK